MAGKLHTYKSSETKKPTTAVPQAQAQGMFKPRPFGLESEQIAPPQQPLDLKTELMRAQRYGYNLSHIQLSNPAPATSVQPKERLGQPLSSQPQTKAPLQAKLAVGQAGDRYEQEADSVASQVVQQINAPAPQQSTQSQSVQREAMRQPIQTAKVKIKPKNPGKYTATTMHDGRTYYHKYDNALGRTIKFSGPIKYVQNPRKNTPKVPYKRKNDAAGHLIAHSFGGPPQFTGNFVAMNKSINGSGGDWGKMESHIRRRLQARNTTAYMSVTPIYSDNKGKRPTSIKATVRFNRPPYKKLYTIQTP